MYLLTIESLKKNTNMRKLAIKRILNIAFYTLVIFLTSYLIFDYIAPEKTVDIFGFKIFVVDSPSMEPTLRVNDAVVVFKTKASKIDEEDIITFEVYLPDLQAKSYVTHYVGEIIDANNQTIYKTHGEGSEIDEWEDEDGNPIEIVMENIIGKVAFKIPGAGHVIKLLKDPVMVLLLASNIAIIVFIFYYVKKQKHINEENKD